MTEVELQPDMSSSPSTPPTPGALWLTGGRQRKPRAAFDLDPNWYGYGSAEVASVEGGSPTSVFSYVSPPDACLQSDPVLFKAGTRRGDLLYVPTQTEVLVLSVPDFAVRHRVSIPWFNDVHHVVPIDDETVYVVNTGLDMVLRLRLDGTVLDAWSVLGEDPWQRFDPSRDYRFGCSTKPHVAHPNFLFLVDGEPFVTRFQLRDAVALRDPRRRIVVGFQRVHDGIVRNGRVFFTTVDGHIVVADAGTLQVIDRIRLDPGDRPEGALGWCRGLLVEGDYCWVGFTRIRPTRFRSVLSWVHSSYTEAATRLSRYKLSDGSLQQEILLEPVGLNAVFAVLSA